MTDSPGYAVEQLDAAALDSMTPDAILAARAEGKFDALLGRPPSTVGARIADGTSQLTEADAMNMSPRQIVEAKAAGRFADLLGQTRPIRQHPTNF